jgi:hypothetical protein
MRHFGDGDAQTLRKCDPAKTRLRLLDAPGTPRPCRHPWISRAPDII